MKRRHSRLLRIARRIADLPLSPYAVDLDFTKHRKEK